MAAQRESRARPTARPLKPQDQGRQQKTAVQEPGAGGIKVKDDAGYFLLLLVTAACYFLPVLASGNEVVLSAAGTDIWNQYYYWRRFGFDALAQGELPLWNPFLFSGAPYVAGIQSAIFYPLNLVHLALAAPAAINFGIALHTLLASFFTYLFARYLHQSPPSAFLSAVTFAYGAPYFLHIYAGHLSNLATMIWLPLLLLATEALFREQKIKYALLGGVALSLQVLAGHPQYLFYSLIAAGLYFVLRFIMANNRPPPMFAMGGFCLLIATGFLLAAVQLAPAVELARHSVRESLTYDWVSIFSFPPENLSTLLLPDFLGDALTVPYWGKNYLWEMSVYLGMVPLLCAVVAIIWERSAHVKIFAVLAVLALVLAFGKHTPLLGLLYAYVPGFNLFRGLSKFVFIFGFAMAMLAGFGLGRLAAFIRTGDPRVIKTGVAFIAFAASLLVIGLGAFILGESGWRALIRSLQSGPDIFAPVADLSDEFFRSAMRGGFLSALKGSVFPLLLGALLLIHKRFAAAQANWLIAAALGIAVIDLWLFGFRYLVSFPPSLLSLDPNLKAFLKKDQEPYRIATPQFSLLNAGLVEKFENVGGYDAIVLKRYNEFINLTQGLPQDEPNIAMAINRFSPLLRLLNVRYYVLSSSARVEYGELEQVFESPDLRVYRDGAALPRSFIVHRTHVIEEPQAALRALAHPRFNPQTAAIVEEAVEGLPEDADSRSPPPRIAERSLNRVVIDAQSRKAGLLVLAETYYPGWKAFIDGRETKVYRVNHIMRGVSLGPGHHRVEFRYAPFSFTLGLAVSAATLIVVAVFLIASIAKRTAQPLTGGGNS